MNGSWSALWPFVTLGLVGSLHCAGMCGGFALAVSGTAPLRWRVFWSRQVVYVVGKAASYACIALAIAAGGRGLGLGPGTGAAGVSIAAVLASVLAGATLLAMGAAHLGWSPWIALRHLRPPRWLDATLRPLFEGARALPGPSAALGTGVLNGLLPCGLSWSIFILASRETPAVAGLGALLFGLTTAPVLLAVALAPRLISIASRERLEPLLGVALLLFGLATLARGLSPGGSGMGGGDCCATSATGPLPTFLRDPPAASGSAPTHSEHANLREKSQP